MIEKKRWDDRQTLTTGLRDAIEHTDSYWVNAVAWRVSKDRSSTKRSAKDPISAVGCIRATYNVPFPLSVLFTSTSIDLRSKAFSFLNTIDFSLRLLARCALVLRQEEKKGGEGWEMWQIRQRLGWFLRWVPFSFRASSGADE